MNIVNTTLSKISKKLSRTIVFVLGPVQFKFSHGVTSSECCTDQSKDFCRADFWVTDLNSNDTISKWLTTVFVVISPIRCGHFSGSVCVVRDCAWLCWYFVLLCSSLSCFVCLVLFCYFVLPLYSALICWFTLVLFAFTHCDVSCFDILWCVVLLHLVLYCVVLSRYRQRLISSKTR